MGEASRVDASGPLNEFIAELQELRVRAGSPSYAEIASRIAHRRRDAGLSDAAARISRSTVYDAFQLGRRRLNPDLVLEIVLALGLGEGEAGEWRARCAHLHRPMSLRPIVQEEAQEAPDQMADVPASRFARARVPANVLLACVALNLLGGWLVMVTRLPVYLDMIGTAIASVVLGPWWGVAAAIATNGGETAYDGTASLPFVAVNMAGALVWGYGVRRLGMGRSLSRFLLLNVVVALTCTVIAVPILLGDFAGITRNAVSDQTLSLAAAYHSLLAGVWSSNTLTSLIDKMLCGLGVLLAASRLPVSYLARLPEGWAMGERHAGPAQFASHLRGMRTRTVGL